MLQKIIVIYLSVFKYFLRFILLPLIVLSRFKLFQKNIDYVMQTNIKEIISKEFLNYLFSKVNLADEKLKLIAVDLGSREGPSSEIVNNKKSFERIILCEGEEVEARKLKEQGYEVIPNFVSDKSKESIFYHFRDNPGASSLKKPGTKYLKLYGGSEYFNNHLNFETINIRTLEINSSLKNLSIDKIDLLKLDIQGCEFEVLNNLLQHSLFPLVIQCEVLDLPFYFDTKYGCEIDKLLSDYNYLCIRSSDEHFRGGMKIWSDKIYIPDPTKPNGYSIISGRENSMHHLSKIYRFEKLFDLLRKI
ncbi:FkbM family methyltransferase [Alphaproteobacteria bacterium]|nr:FkbM family methyltransferase [Alphaproteobacteria bacterium]